eukprot:GHVT01060591.1.p1 GENE.GHVT01060591.1~~GHVT01060591.1.p1  ORF type:complete len:476 (+),score=65.97 GHVT01060591.1:319-1746(+)
MAWTGSSSTEQGLESSVVTSDPSTVTVCESSLSNFTGECESSLSNFTGETAVHAMESTQGARGPDDGPKFSTSRGRSRKAKMQSQRSTVKGSTTKAKQGGQKKKQLIAGVVAGLTAVLLVGAGIGTVAMLYKSKSGQVASADKEALAQPPSSSLSASSEGVAPANKNVSADTNKISKPDSKQADGKTIPVTSANKNVSADTNKISKPDSKQADGKTISVPSSKPGKRPDLRANVTYDEGQENEKRMYSKLRWTPEAIQARKEECANEVEAAPHAELRLVDDVRVREKRRLKHHQIRARQQEDLIFDALNPANPCTKLGGMPDSTYFDSYVDIQKKVGDDSLLKLRFMTLHRLQLFDHHPPRDFVELWKTFKAVGQTQTNYDLDHENQVQALPYIKKIRKALKNAKDAEQLARQLIHIISNERISLKLAHKVETFSKLEKRLEKEIKSGHLENQLSNLAADESEFRKNDETDEWRR